MRFPSNAVSLAVVLGASWTAPSSSAGQELHTAKVKGQAQGLNAKAGAKLNQVVLEISSFDSLRSFQVVEARPDGRLRIQLLPTLANPRVTIAEGYHVMIADPENSPGPLRLFRSLVNEVTDDSTLVLTVGPEAAKQLHAGDHCNLFRPVNATTAQLRGLPDLIPLGRKPTDTPAARVAAHRAGSILNLRRLAIALHNFESATNHLPPSVIHGPDGKPWHSWRVLILPYVEEGALFKEYDFSQPWNGPKNIKLLDRMPDVYRDPVHGDAKGHFTHYAALVGAWKGRFLEVHTAFPPSVLKMKDPAQPPFEVLDDGAPKLSDATDGPDETIAIAPVSPERKIPWTKPEDITAGPEFPRLGKPGGIAAPYPIGEDLEGPRSAPVLMLDGKVMVLRDTIKPDLLRALITRDGRNAGVLVEEVDFFQVPVIPLLTPGLDQERVLKIRIDGAKAQAWVE